MPMIAGNAGSKVMDRCGLRSMAPGAAALAAGDLGALEGGSGGRGGGHRANLNWPEHDLRDIGLPTVDQKQSHFLPPPPPPPLAVWAFGPAFGGPLASAPTMAARLQGSM